MIKWKFIEDSHNINWFFKFYKISLTKLTFCKCQRLKLTFAPSLSVEKKQMPCHVQVTPEATRQVTMADRGSAWADTGMYLVRLWWRRWSLCGSPHSGNRVWKSCAWLPWVQAAAASAGYTWWGTASSGQGSGDWEAGRDTVDRKSILLVYWQLIALFRQPGNSHDQMLPSQIYEHLRKGENPLICRCVRTKKRSMVRKKSVHFQSCWDRIQFCSAKILTN